MPAVQRWKAVEHLMLCDRAAEELGRIADDISSTLQHYTVLHNSLSQAVFGLSSTAERALLKRRIVDMEFIMTGIWQVANKHLDNVVPMPSFRDGQMNANSEVPVPDVVLTELNTVASVDSDYDYDSEEDDF